jgi:glycine/D-amino acid oxidase-like deaminating enzyme
MEPSRASRLTMAISFQGNVVISPGAHANGALLGTLAHKQIAGVLGAWLTLPDPGVGLRNSLKLARKGHIVEDANVTVAFDENGYRVVIIGSGYGFTGFDPSNIDQELLEHIYACITDTAKQFFRESYQQILEDGSLRDSLKYCVRPWTPTGLGIFETMQAANDDRLIVVGGHNTGGFAQAPGDGHGGDRLHPRSPARYASRLSARPLSDLRPVVS